MTPGSLPRFDDAAILAARGPKVALNPREAYAWSVETEPGLDGALREVGTVFLTNRECPFRCLMCDLWTHTLDESVAPGDILAQLDSVLEAMPSVGHLKLYNAGNFFDAKAIPRVDRQAIASRLAGFDLVTIENHPRLCGPSVREFRQFLGTELEVAMGLETVHPEVLPQLNKRMTLDDYTRAVGRLRRWDIHVRTFVLLGLPGVPRSEYVDWAVRSTGHALSSGSGVCSIIPTRTGNGIMDSLADRGLFAEPDLGQMEQAQRVALSGHPNGRVFMDLWDADRFAAESCCQEQRIEAMRQANLSQTPGQPVRCAKCGEEA